MKPERGKESFPHYVTSTWRTATAHLQIQEGESTTFKGYEAPWAKYSERAEAMNNRKQL